MKKAFVFILLTALAPAAWAYEEVPSGYAHNDPVAGATRKLGRGVANISFGWIELLKGIQSVSEEKGVVAGLTWGPLYGAANAVRRTGVGVAETATFPISDNKYEPILEPEFILSDEN